MTIKPLRIFVPLTKVDAENRLVYGRVACEDVDRSGEVFDYESSKPNFEKWSGEMSKASGGKNLGNLRAMHRPVAAGMIKSLDFFDDEKSIEAVAKVVDDDEWKKVEEGVYTGFSMGGSYARKWTDAKGNKRYTANPVEVSLVDAPCIKSATFDYSKGANVHELRKFTPYEPTSPEIAKEAEELGKAAGKPWTGLIAEARASLIEKRFQADGELDLTGHADCIEGPPSEEDLKKAMERTTTRERTSTTERIADDQKKEEAKDEGDQTQDSGGKEKATDKEKDAADKGGDGKVKSEKVDGLASEDDEPADAKKLAEARELVKQVWVTTDGKISEKKEDAVKAQAGIVVVPDNPLTKAVAAANAALEGKPKAGEDVLAKFWAEPANAPFADLGKLSKALVKMDALAKEQKSDVLRKGVYDVGRFAEAIQTLGYIQNCLSNEADYEKDGSKVPKDLRSALAGLVSIFLDMAKEEMSEMLASLPGGVVADDVAADPEVGVLIAQTTKAVEASTLAKIGARNSKADSKRLQGIHDYLVELGVVCSQDAVEKLRKDAGQVEGLNKIIADAVPAIEKLTKGFEEQAAEIAKLKAQPMPGGPARLQVMEKGANGDDRAVQGSADPTIVAELIKNFTPEQIQTMMFKAAQAKPIALIEKGELPRR